MGEMIRESGARAKVIAKRWRGLALASVAGCALLAAAVLLWPMDTARYLTVDASGEIVDRGGETLMAFLNREEQWCFPRPLNEVSPYLVKATIAAEDQRFRKHPGVDLIAVIRAASQNLRSRGVVSGASTLTMQVVKSGPASSRSLIGKLIQTVEALRLDARVSKDRILETYLNSAPYGLNLVGCEAAARRYFGVPARELDIAEAALLAGLPKSPTGFMPLAHPAAARERRDYVLGRMLKEGYINRKDFERAIDTPLDVSWHEYPMLSPHLAMRLEPLTRSQNRVSTRLDLAIQERAEAVVAEHLKRWDGEITNAAVLVADVESAGVRARVGSGDFFQTPGGGQVDACRALRSPGSTLKPFIYGYAIEHDLVYPCETLYDGTLDYGRYNPANFDGNYNGLVSAAEALRFSLNVPAITVLDRIGVIDFCAFLPEMGITSAVKAPEAYGLGLALGNCEVRLEEMAAAYCMIASEGEYRPLRTLASHSAAEPKRCLSRGTCQALYAMLEQPLPEEFDADLVLARSLSSRVCWKTGTSADYRDAWAFLFNRHYVVGVWMGNNDASPSKRLVGFDAALPLAAEVFRKLPPKDGPAWPEGSEEMKTVNVCALSGLPAAKWCPHTRVASIPREQHMLRVCDVHYPAADTSAVSARYVERWPGSAMKWDLAAVGAGRMPGLSNPVGPKTREDELRILNPSNKAAFVLTGEANGDRIKLRASTEGKSVLYWYVDKSYVGESRPGNPVLLNLEEGAHQLTCMDPQGAIDSIAFEVTRPETSSLRGS